MRQLCVAQIPAAATVAIADCKGHGGKTSFGAETRYNLVATAGSLFWRDRPTLSGTWTSQADAARRGAALAEPEPPARHRHLARRLGRGPASRASSAAR